MLRVAVLLAVAGLLFILSVVFPVGSGSNLNSMRLDSAPETSGDAKNLRSNVIGTWTTNPDPEMWQTATTFKFLESGSFERSRLFLFPMGIPFMCERDGQKSLAEDRVLGTWECSDDEIHVSVTHVAVQQQVVGSGSPPHTEIRISNPPILTTPERFVYQVRDARGFSLILDNGDEQVDLFRVIGGSLQPRQPMVSR